MRPAARDARPICRASPSRAHKTVMPLRRSEIDSRQRQRISRARCRRSRSRRLLKARSGSVVFPAMLHKEPRVSNAASWKSGAGMSRTPWLECWSSGLTSWGSNLKPSTMIPSSGGRSAQAQGIGEGARQGARSGSNATGPVGGVTGGIAGGVQDVFRIHHYRYYNHHYYHHRRY